MPRHLFIAAKGEGLSFAVGQQDLRAGETVYANVSLYRLSVPVPGEESMEGEAVLYILHEESGLMAEIERVRVANGAFTFRNIVLGERFACFWQLPDTAVSVCLFRDQSAEQLQALGWLTVDPKPPTSKIVLT